MTTRTQLLLGGLLAALALSASVTSAGAARFSLSNQSFRVIWDPTEFFSSEPIFFEEEMGSGPLLACNMVIEGSFHSRSIVKNQGTLIGYVTNAYSEGCEPEFIILNGIETLPNGNESPNRLPWHIRYDSFIGTLPVIQTLRVQFVGVAFLIHFPLGVGCLFLSTAARPWYARFNLGAGGVITTMTAEAGGAIPISRILEGVCGRPGVLRGRGEVFILESTRTRLTVTLI